MRENRLPISRVPFAVLGEMILDCQNGTDRKTKAKEKYRQAKDNEIMVRKLCHITKVSMHICYMICILQLNFSKNLAY